MSDFPVDLTTSNWVDCLKGKTRDEQIACLATYHRRIEHAAKVSALSELADPNPDGDEKVKKAVAAAIKSLREPVDYKAD